MAKKEIRNMKVYDQSGYRYKSTPTIMLKGQWLKKLGFDSGTFITVKCEDGKLIITPREVSSYIDEYEAQQICMVAEKKEGYR
ncbi:MAG: SymE family type I addiction module toxin [Lachnospiraceae bacterium]|nr:SymE family type I addiction module toxin [Lachnospiraceae bacterium]